MSKKVVQCLDSWRPISDRIIEARSFSRCIRTTVIQVYAPVNEADDEVKDDFYEQLQKIVDEVLRHDMLLVAGDWNAKVSEQQLGEEGTVGKFGMTGERSDNGERFQCVFLRPEQSCYCINHDPTQRNIQIHVDMSATGAY